MNTIELPVSELKTALAGLNKIVSKSTCLPVLKNIRVTRTTAGQVTLQATDLDIAATYQAEAQQPGPVCDVLVPIEPLTKVVKNSTNDGRVALVKEAKNQFTLRTFVGNSPVDQKLETLDLKEWPPVPRCDLPAVTLNEEIRAAVASAMECSGEESTRPLLQGAWIDPTDPKAHYVLATDGRHLFTANSFCVDFKEPVLLPNKKFVQWNGFMDDGDWKVSILPPEKKDEPGWLQVESDHWRFISKRVEGQCPNWRNAVPSPTEAKTLIRFSAEALAFLQQLLPKLPGGDAFNRPVTLEVNEQNLIVKAHPKNQPDWTKVTVPDTRITGKPMAITLNRDYLIKALSFDLVNLDMYDEVSPVVFHHGGQRMVVMPIRLDAGSPPPASNAQPTPAQPAETPVEQVATPKPETQPTEERTTMPKTTEAQTAETAPESPVKSIGQHIEIIKESLKSVVRDLNDLLDLVKKTEKEKKASEKEIEAVREKLREIQSVKI
jgi:DNA polymerase III sliding clamp (beta) subunit (PCNA family)